MICKFVSYIWNKINTGRKEEREYREYMEKQRLLRDIKDRL